MPHAKANFDKKTESTVDKSVNGIWLDELL
jgi:hypothetical protein